MDVQDFLNQKLADAGLSLAAVVRYDGNEMAVDILDSFWINEVSALFAQHGKQLAYGTKNAYVVIDRVEFTRKVCRNCAW